jgi:AraC-like DNA-binding protein
MSRLSRLGYIDTRHTKDPVRRRVRSRGVPAALQGHEVFYSEDVQEASELIGKALAPNRLTVAGIGARNFAAALHGVRVRDISLLHLDLHVPVSITMPVSGPYYAVHMPTNGGAAGTVHARPFTANPVRALVTNPGDALEMRLDHDSPQLILRIEQDALERFVTRSSGRTLSQRLTFDPELDLTTEAAMRWHAAIQLLNTEVFYKGSLIHGGQGIGALEDLLMSSLLVVQPSSHHALLGRPTANPGRRTVRHSIDYIEHHLSEQISMTDIAQHAGASIRSVQQGFRDELGMTPMAYIRDRRLERVRAELADATVADGVTVTAVAQHWGFHHLGSFAVLYRKRWGESPSQTLRR